MPTIKLTGSPRCQEVWNALDSLDFCSDGRGLISLGGTCLQLTRGERNDGSDLQNRWSRLNTRSWRKNNCPLWLLWKAKSRNKFVGNKINRHPFILFLKNHLVKNNSPRNFRLYGLTTLKQKRFECEWQKNVIIINAMVLVHWSECGRKQPERKSESSFQGAKTEVVYQI